ERRSAGLGGIGPLASSHRFGCWVSTTWRVNGSSVVSILLRPIWSSAALNAGLRRSLSINSTLRSRRAKFWASASADDDLPSPDRVLVTRSTFGMPDSVLNRSAATTAEYASETIDVGFLRSSMKVTLAGVRGTDPRHGSDSLRRTS